MEGTFHQCTRMTLTLLLGVFRVLGLVISSCNFVSLTEFHSAQSVSKQMLQESSSATERPWQGECRGSMSYREAFASG